MASAPGQSSAPQEPTCYNCGQRGHWVMACPEPTREVPAGLQRWQSRHSEQLPERSNAGPDKKPPVVTRYAPPPPAYTPPTLQYGQHPPPPYPPAGQPPGQPYPQSYQQAPYYSSGYPPPPPPGPPQYGSYPPPPPPPPPPPSFNQHHPPPPHPPYGQPLPGSQYPPQGTQYQPSLPPPPPPPPPGYYNGPQAPYPPTGYPPPSHPPPANYQVPPYPPSGSPAPPPGYHQGPYPSVHYQPNTMPPYPPAPLPPPPVSYSQDSPWNQPPTPDATQLPRHQRGKHKKHQGPRRVSSNAKGRKGFDRHRSSPVVKPVIPILDDASPAEPHSGPNRDQEPEVPDHVTEDESNDVVHEDWSVEAGQDFAVVFAEAAGKVADPVGIPLPYIYTDDPTIPPAYNATCIKSQFFNEGKMHEFVTSVRDSKAWATLLDDPTFKQYPGMILRRFPSSSAHAYPTYEVPIRHGNSGPVKLPPKFQVNRKALEEALRRQREQAAETSPKPEQAHGRDWEPISMIHNERDRNHEYRPRSDKNNKGFNRTPNNHLGKRVSDDSRQSDNRDLKRSRRSPSYQATPPSTGRGSMPHRTPLGRVDLEGRPWSPRADTSWVEDLDPAENPHRSARDRLHRAPSSSRRDRSKERQSANPRHDSGYHSGQSPDKSRPGRRGHDDDRRPRRRSYSRGRSPSRSLDGPVSRASSATASDDRSRSGSPLTAMEYELLGLSRPSKTKETKTLKMVKRQVKVSAAYGRRW